MATREQAKRALDRHEDDLSQRANVVGLGVVPCAEGDGMAVGVYVRKKLPRARLAPADVVPENVSIPGRSETIEVPVRVIEQGEVSLERPGG